MKRLYGTPNSDVSYFLETLERSGVRPSDQPRLRRYDLEQERHRRPNPLWAFPYSAGFQASGRATHRQPGSVGLPAYQDDRPFPLKMETGSPHARYAIVEKRNGSWSAELRAVVYDWENAAADAEQRQRPDWARALRSGRA
jgi:hypothetical protein